MVQARLGHASIQMTADRYGHLFPRGDDGCRAGGGGAGIVWIGRNRRMATLHEYFVKDGAENLTTHQVWHLNDKDGTNLGEVTARLHLDFNANAKYRLVLYPGYAWCRVSRDYGS